MADIRVNGTAITSSKKLYAGTNQIKQIKVNGTAVYFYTPPETTLFSASGSTMEQKYNNGYNPLDISQTLFPIFSQVDITAFYLGYDSWEQIEVTHTSYGIIEKSVGGFVLYSTLVDMGGGMSMIMLELYPGDYTLPPKIVNVIGRG